LKILALDTSSKVASVALCEDGQPLAEFTLNHSMTHSTTLLPLIDQMLQALTIEISDIDAFAASKGPGSFTGLRIGLSTLKAFAYSLNKPLIMVDTLEAMAYNLYPHPSMVCSMLDARNSQVFVGLYRLDNERYQVFKEPFATHITDLLEMLKTQDMDVVFIGDALKLHQTLISDALGKRASFPCAFNAYQRASAVAHLAVHHYHEGNFEDAKNAYPFYLRPPSAEQMKNRS
jgi:tRNA threonylcarbamoyladenosine biosynthesis protein TsaB